MIDGQADKEVGFIQEKYRAQPRPHGNMSNMRRDK